MTGSLSPFNPFWGTERDIPNFCFYTGAFTTTNLDFFTFLYKKFCFHASLFLGSSFSDTKKNTLRFFQVQQSTLKRRKALFFHEVLPLLRNTSLRKPDGVRYVSSSASRSGWRRRREKKSTGVFKEVMSCAVGRTRLARAESVPWACTGARASRRALQVSNFVWLTLPLKYKKSVLVSEFTLKCFVNN